MTAKSRMKDETHAVYVSITICHFDVVDFSHCQCIKRIRQAHALNSPNMSVFILERLNTDIFQPYKTRDTPLFCDLQFFIKICLFQLR